MKHCIYCSAYLSEREETLFGDRCEDHAAQFGGEGTEVTPRRPLHDEYDDEYDLGEDNHAELNFE